MQKFDIAIIGGGILGCATAYFLARQGQTNVVVFERNRLAEAATARAAAMFNRARPRTQERQMVRDTNQVILDLQEELGESLDYRNVGSLCFAGSDIEKDKLKTLTETCLTEGDQFHWLTGAEAKEKAAWLDGVEDHLIAWCPEDGYIDPYLLGAGYGRAARQRGVTIRQGVEVTDVLIEAGKIVGVETSEGRVACDQVIDAAGSWAAVLAKRAGVALPLAPVRSHYWITESKAPFDQSHPVMVMPDAKAYARPEVGRMMFGIRDAQSAYVTPENLPSDLLGFSFDEDYEGWDALAEGIEPLLRYAPALEGAGIEHYISGPSAYTADGAFVIGRSKLADGFIAVTGCCGAGIAHSSGFGKSGAALALNLDLPYDLSPYDPDRFTDIDPLSDDFCGRCAATRSNKTAA